VYRFFWGNIKGGQGGPMQMARPGIWEQKLCHGIM
jgi:hypothetical protein